MMGVKCSMAADTEDQGVQSVAQGGCECGQHKIISVLKML